MISGGLAGGGTTQSNDPIVIASMDIMELLNFIGNLLMPLAKALRVAGKAFSWIKGAGYILAGFTALATYSEMLSKTHCKANAVVAGLLDLALNALAGLAIIFLLGLSGGLGLLGIVFLVGIVTVFFILIEDYLLNIIRQQQWCFRFFKRGLYEKSLFLSNPERTARANV